MNTDISILNKYFKNLSPNQQSQFEKLQELYAFWNAQINVVSRKDIDLLYERHVLHSLGIAKVMQFKRGTRILDIGTGGGFPGIPLAIMFPEAEFVLVDSIGKKIKVVNEVINALGLKNANAFNERAEGIKEKFDFVLSRGVTDFSVLRTWVQHKFNKRNMNQLPNGLLCLKGGDLTEELKGFKSKAEVFNLSDYFKEEFFITKKVVYMPC